MNTPKRILGALPIALAMASPAYAAEVIVDKEVDLSSQAVPTGNGAMTFREMLGSEVVLGLGDVLTLNLTFANNQTLSYDPTSLIARIFIDPTVAYTLSDVDLTFNDGVNTSSYSASSLGYSDWISGNAISGGIGPIEFSGLTLSGTVAAFDSGDPNTYNGTYFRFGGSDFAVSQASGNLFRVAQAQGAVPEPGTWALLLLGFFGVGASLRRQRRNVRTSVSYA